MRTTTEPTTCHGTVRFNPSSVKHALAIDEATQGHIERSRDAIRTLISHPGSDGRLLVMVGPCSIHDPDAALDYASHLAKAAKKYRDELLIVMRVYVEKPRSTVGWKGLLHDPDHALATRSHSVGRKSDVKKGVLVSRRVMLSVAKKGLPIATELLSPLLVPFFQDLVTVGIVGARTTESQTHREMASGLPMPIGFKNGTDGSVKVAIDAMTATATPQTVVGVDDEGFLGYRVTSGNSHGFVVLRGGSKGPNFGPDDIHDAERHLFRAGKKPSIVVDCSHGNSMKDYRNQAAVAACVADQVAVGGPIMGVMIESNINEGKSK